MAEIDFINWYKTTFDYGNPNPAGKGNNTAYFRYWELGVAVPIPNHHFSYPYKLRKLLSTNVAIAATAMTIQCASTAEAAVVRRIITTGYAKLSRADDSLSEIVEVISVDAGTGSTVTINLFEGLDNAFSTNDIFLYYSTILADKWFSDDDFLKVVSLVKSLPADLNNIDGKVVAQQLNVLSTDLISPQGGTFHFHTNFQDDIHRYISNSYSYRIGCRYYIRWASEISAKGTVKIKTDLSSAFEWVNLTYFDNSAANLNKYYLFNSAAKTGIFRSSSDIRNNSAYRNLKFEFDFGTTHPTGVTYVFGLDDIYFEHSGGVESSMGCLLLPNAPVRESLTIGRRDGIEDLLMANNDLYRFNAKGNPNFTQKYTLSGSFENISLAQYNKMRLLDRFQNDGFLLNLHPHLPELPEVLTGYLKLGEAKKSVFSFSKTSCDFEFVEA